MAVEDAATTVVTEAGASRFVTFEVTAEVGVTHRQERRGRPGAATRYLRVETNRFSLSWSVDHETVAHDAASDGCFPFVTTEREATPAELLRIYKAQPHLERRHATFKGVIAAAPIMLKSDCRIDAFGFCLYVALLVHALVERELRRAMAARRIKALPLYPEDRDCQAPTAARVFDLLDPLTRTVVRHHDRVLAVADPDLSPLQERLLTLLAVPMTDYWTSLP